MTLWGGEERSVATHKCSATLIAHRLAEALLPPKGKGVRPHPAEGFPSLKEGANPFPCPISTEMPLSPYPLPEGALPPCGVKKFGGKRVRGNGRGGGRIRHPRLPLSLPPEGGRGGGKGMK